jgi:CheY-like chemotaxis protein
VLLVEDHPMNRDMLSRRLTRVGHTVSVAEDGEIGLKKASAELPEIILLDMSLPGIDGWDVARKLKASVATKAIPLVALTAHAMAGDRQRCMEAGCDDYATKPVQFDALCAVIDRWVATLATVG